ncbi:hypothetical protein ACFC0M_15645 [Streptomyces sp. NPDC056149]|uniref:hypothetical protein n=1 Tax=Streptomyces sp. NPDC056149 TaxID=3345728 RepID=UPI0035D732E9
MDQAVRHVVVEAAGTDTDRRVLRRAGQEAVRHRARLRPVLLHPPGPDGLRSPLPHGERLEDEECGGLGVEALIRGPATACHGTVMSPVAGGGGRHA